MAKYMVDFFPWLSVDINNLSIKLTKDKIDFINEKINNDYNFIYNSISREDQLLVYSANGNIKELKTLLKKYRKQPIELENIEIDIDIDILYMIENDRDDIFDEGYMICKRIEEEIKEEIEEEEEKNNYFY